MKKIIFILLLVVSSLTFSQSTEELKKNLTGHWIYTFEDKIPNIIEFKSYTSTCSITRFGSEMANYNYSFKVVGSKPTIFIYIGDFLYQFSFVMGNDRILLLPQFDGSTKIELNRIK